MPLLQKLDYGITDYKKREEIVNGLFNQFEENVVEGLQGLDDFWIDIFEQKMEDKIDTSHIKASLNQCDALYSESEIAKILEIIGTYLIMSPDVREQEKESQEKIRIYHSKELFNRATKEKEKIKKLATVSPDEFTLDILVKQKNYKKASDIKITNKDIKEIPVLTDYAKALNQLRERNKELSLGNKLTAEELKERRIIRKQIALIKKDMEYSYVSAKRPIKFKQPLTGYSTADWNALDMMDEDVMMELLKITMTDDINNDLNTILYDLEILLDKVDFTEKQRNILLLYRGGYGLSEIGDVCGSSKQSVHRMLKGCVKKIVDTYIKEYSEWYYLDVCKGEYKKCNTCGSTLLVQNFSKKGNSYRSSCKQCEKAEREMLKYKNAG